MNQNGKINADGAEYERSPSGGHQLVYRILGCEAARCESKTAVTTDPEETVFICGNHTLEEFEEIAEVKRA